MAYGRASRGTQGTHRGQVKELSGTPKTQPQAHRLGFPRLDPIGERTSHLDHVRGHEVHGSIAFYLEANTPLHRSDFVSVYHVARPRPNRHDGRYRRDRTDDPRYVPNRFAPPALEQAPVSKLAVFEQIPRRLYLCRDERRGLFGRPVLLRRNSTGNLEPRDPLVHPALYFFLHDLLFGLCLGRTHLEKPHHLRRAHGTVLGTLLYHRGSPRICRRLPQRPTDNPIDRRRGRHPHRGQPTRSIAVLERTAQYVASRLR